MKSKLSPGTRPRIFGIAVALVLTYVVLDIDIRCAVGQGLVAYQGAVIETMGPAGRIDNGTILVRDGAIEAIGADVEIPPGAKVVSLAGQTVIPGIVDPYYVYAEQQRPSSDNGSSRFGRGRFGGGGGGNVTEGPFTRIADYFFPYNTDFNAAVRTGITTANLVTRGRGQSAFARLTTEPSEEMLLDPDGLLFAAVTNQTRALDNVRNGLDPERSSRRGGSFRGGRGTTGRRGGFGRDGSSGNEESEGGGESEERQPASPTELLWQSVRKGESPLLLNVNNTASILHLMRVLQDHGDVKVALVSSGTNLYEVLDKLKRPHTTLVLQPTVDRLPYRDEAINVPKLLVEMEIPFVLSLSLDERQMEAQQDDPLFGVSYLVKTGLPRVKALEALTIEPARLLGLEDKVGSLEEKKLANLLVYDGDPLETGSRLRQVIVEGRTVYED